MISKKINNPLIVTVFGVTGDLSSKKIIPAIFSLFKKNKLPKDFIFVGFARKDFNNDQFRDFIKNVLPKDDKIQSFLEKSFYFQADFFDINYYFRFTKFLSDIEQGFGTCSDKIFHLSVPPDIYKVVLENLFNAGLSIICKNRKNSFSRFLVEKPFGQDYKSSKELNKLAEKLFTKDQVFRIDHYNAKRFLENIKNTDFDYKDIEKIEIKLLENNDLEKRASFYDKVGTISDVFQSHILQIILAFFKNRKNVLRSLTFNKNTLNRGQYLGYREHLGVKQNSNTETFFKGEFYFKKGLLKSVPIFVSSGKAMNQTLTEILVKFKTNKELRFSSKDESGNAYETVLLDAVKDNKDIFVDKNEVLDSWKITERLKNQINKKNLFLYKKFFYDGN